MNKDDLIGALVLCGVCILVALLVATTVARDRDSARNSVEAATDSRLTITTLPSDGVWVITSDAETGVPVSSIDTSRVLYYGQTAIENTTGEDLVLLNGSYYRYEVEHKGLGLII